MSYAWTQTAGETVTLTAPAAATTTFTAPSNLATDATLTFTLRVTDAGGLHDDDTVQITITAASDDATPDDATAQTSDTTAEDDATPSPFDANDAAAYVAARDMLVSNVQVGAGMSSFVYAILFRSWAEHARDGDNNGVGDLDATIPLGEDDPNSLPSPADPQALKDAIDELAEAAGLLAALIDAAESELATSVDS